MVNKHVKMVRLTNNQGSKNKNEIPLHTYWIGKTKKPDSNRDFGVLTLRIQIGRTTGGQFK